MFSYILGGACWISASKLINEMKKEHQEKFFTAFKLHLTNRFGDVIADWSCLHYK
jgi:ABC-type transporter MlaC component